MMDGGRLANGCEPLKIEVETVPGVANVPEPRSFLLGSRHVGVAQVVDRWLSPAHAYFRIRTDDGALYILRHDVPTKQWEMTLFRAAGLP